MYKIACNCKHVQLIAQSELVHNTDVDNDHYEGEIGRSRYWHRLSGLQHSRQHGSLICTSSRTTFNVVQKHLRYGMEKN